MGVRKAIAALLEGLIDYYIGTESGWRASSLGIESDLIRELDAAVKDMMSDLSKLGTYAVPETPPVTGEPRATSSPGSPAMHGAEGERSGFTSEEARRYTLERTIEHLVAVEDHMRSARTDLGVCVGCLLEHHLPALSMYAKEGLKFCKDEGECGAYRELASVVNEAKKRLLEGDTNFEELAEKFRSVRKRLSPASKVVEKIRQKLESTELKTFTPAEAIRLVEPRDCRGEVIQLVQELGPKVAERVAKRNKFRLQPIELQVETGRIVINGREPVAATNPDRRPVVTVFNCEIWNGLPKEMKKRVVAHELAHAFGVKDEGEADEIALEVVGS